jgi:hypothetical protein
MAASSMPATTMTSTPVTTPSMPTTPMAATVKVVPHMMAPVVAVMVDATDENIAAIISSVERQPIVAVVRIVRGIVRFIEGAPVSTRFDGTSAAE